MVAHKRLAVVALWLLATAPAAGSPDGSTPEPPCRAEAELLPSRALVGQQVLWRVRVASDEDVTEIAWTVPPRFPDVRSERLQGQPDLVLADGRGGKTRIHEERRALFPERAGEIEIRPPGLRCSLAGGGSFDASVSASLLRVTWPPETGRPSDYAGLIGPLSVETRVEPDRIPLGGSVRLFVSLRGGGNLWDAPDPFVGSESVDAEWFAAPPVLELQPGTRLGIQRIFEYDVVPRRQGSLLIPKLQIPYYDPARASYGIAEAAALQVTVTARPPVASLPPAQPVAEATADPRAGRWLVPAALGVAVLALAITAFERRRRSPRSAAAKQLEAARAARARGDRDAEAAALARALRDALRPHLPVGDASPDELLAGAQLRTPVAAALRVLRAVERARFDADAKAPRASEVARAIAEL